MAPPVHNPDGENNDLNAMVRDIAFQVREIHADIQKQNKVLTHLMNWKTGGDTPANGIDIRMDRIERAHKGVGKIAWAAVTGAATSCGAMIWYLLTGRHHG